MNIGITSADDPTPDNYVAAIRRFGGHPVVLPSDLTRFDELLSGVHGVLISGGTDIDPAEYGAPRHDQTDLADHARDTFELAVARYASEHGIPLLMICRGMQIGNIAFGGTLHQHLPDIVDAAVKHRDLERKFDVFPEHVVTVAAGSRLAALAGGTRFMTNASHHQAVDRVGRGLMAVAHTGDGIIEALEYPQAHGFWLAVQWHPERLLDAEADENRSERIFRAFLEAAGAFETNVRARKRLPNLPAM